MRTVGGAFGGQIAAAIVSNSVVVGTGFASESGYTAAFLLGTAAALGALVAATLVPGRRTRAEGAVSAPASEAPVRG